MGTFIFCELGFGTRGGGGVWEGSGVEARFGWWRSGGGGGGVGGGKVVGQVDPGSHGSCFVEGANILREKFSSEFGLKALDEPTEKVGVGGVFDEEGCLAERVDVGGGRGGMFDGVEAMASLEVWVVGGKGVGQASLEVGEGGEGTAHGPVQGRPTKEGQGDAELQVGSDAGEDHVVAEEEQETIDVVVGSLVAGEGGRLEGSLGSCLVARKWRWRGGGGEKGGTGRRLHVVVEGHVAERRVFVKEVGEGWLVAITLFDLKDGGWGTAR